MMYAAYVFMKTSIQWFRKVEYFTYKTQCETLSKKKGKKRQKWVFGRMVPVM